MEYFEIIKNLFDGYVLNRFHRKSGLFTSLFISFVFLLWVHEKIKDDFNYEWYLYISIFTIIIFSWIYSNYMLPYPKNKPDKKTGNKKTGLVIAISYENYEGAKIKNKFIKELERNINDSGLNKYFNIISIPEVYSEKLKNKEDLEKLHIKVGGHIYFYGDIQKENDGKEIKKYFLNIDGYVKHLPIPIPLSQELSFDFRAVLPKEISFSDFFELRGCRATAKIVYLTTKYVVGVASVLSGNPFLAYEMHKNLTKELDEYKKIDKDKNIKNITNFDFKQLNKIKNKLPLIISNEAYVISNIYYINNKYDESLLFLDQSFKNNPNNYNSFLLKAIYDFQLDNDPPKALESIKKAKKLANGKLEWMYSYAFLKFWESDYAEAYRMCTKIKEKNFPGINLNLANTSLL